MIQKKSFFHSMGIANSRIRCPLLSMWYVGIIIASLHKNTVLYCQLFQWRLPASYEESAPFPIYS